MAVDTSANIGIRVFLDDAASRGLYAMNTQLGQMGGLAQKAGLGLGTISTSMVGLAVVTGIAASFLMFGGAIAYSTVQAANFEVLIVRIQRATNATSAEMDRMRQVMMDLGGSSIFSLDQIAEGFVLMGQRGISATDIMNGVGKAGVLLAESIGATPVQAMGLLASTMASFNLPASEAMHTANLLQFAFEHGVPSVTQLTAAMAKIGSVSSILKVPLDQVVPAIDILARAMGSGTQAATALYYFMSQVSSGTKGFKAEIAKLGLSFYDVHDHFIGLNQALDQLYAKLKDKTPREAADILHALFNIKAGTGIGILMEDLGRLHDLSQNLAASHDNLGMVIARAKQAVDTAQGSWNALKTNLQDIAIIVGGPFLAAIKPLIDNLLLLSQTVRTWASENPQATTSILLLGTALSGIALVVIAVMTPIGQFALIMLATMAVITGITVGIVWLKANWGALAAQMQSVWNAAQPLLAVLLTVGAVIAGIALAPFYIALGLVAVYAVMTGLAFLGTLPSMIAYIGRTIAATAVTIAQALGNQQLILSLILSASAWVANAAAATLAALPYILIAALVALMIIGLVLLLQHLGFLNVLLAVGRAAWAAILPALIDAGNAIKGAFLQAIQQLKPVWDQLVVAFHQAEPVLIVLGAALGGLIALALGIVMGLLRGLINVLVAVITTVINVVAGIIQVFAGLVQFFMGFFTALHGLFTGIATNNWTEFQNGVRMMGQGIINIFTGLWNAVKAVFVGAFQAIVGFVSGFIQGIVGFFQHLADTLVHRSIVPDMMKAILTSIAGAIPGIIGAVVSLVGQFIGNIASLPGRIVSAIGNAAAILHGAGQGVIQGLINGVSSFFGNLGGKIGELAGRVRGAIGNAGSWLYDAGRNIIQGLINGLWSMLSALLGAAGGILNRLRGLFPHSPAKEGPLTDAHTWMPNLMKILTETTEASGPSLQSSMSRVAGRVQTGFFSPTGGAGGAGGAAGETYNLNVDGRAFMSFFHNRLTGELQANGLGRLLR